MKFCNKCNQNKEETSFGKDSKKSDGLNNYCRECIKKRSLAQRLANPEYCQKYAAQYREKNREDLRSKAYERFVENREESLARSRKSYANHKDEIALRRAQKREDPEFREKMRIHVLKWRRENPDKFVKSVRKWQLANRIKINAHAKVHTAVKNGTLIRSELCERCGSNEGKMEGHHENYNQPLNVQWLCRLCHASLIKKF